MHLNLDIPNQKIHLEKDKIELYLKREDAIHPLISGNKYRKLKYNIEAVLAAGFKTVLSFGGAFSNHLCALAAIGKEYNLNTIGVIRGAELKTNKKLNPTLRYARSCGMQFKFISRDTYRYKANHEFINGLINEFGPLYILPEGGTNQLAVKGCEEILNATDFEFHYVCCPVGTGGTIAGLINASRPHQKILGFLALKGDYLKNKIKKYTNKRNWQLTNKYHFGGYAKINKELIEFINWFKEENEIMLDPIYTGKMMFGIYDMVAKGFFKPNCKILAIHTGGTQGIAGMNQRLRRCNLKISI